MSILDHWQLTEAELTQLVSDNPSLRGMMFGYIAEHKFHEMIISHPRVCALRKDDDHNRKLKGDRVFSCDGREIRIEVKSLQTNSIKRQENGRMTATAQCDASDRRRVTFADGSSLETTCLLPGEFDVLAINLFAFTNKWEFAFALNSELPRSTFRKYTPYQREQLLASLLKLEYPLQPPYTSDFDQILERITPLSDCFSL